MARDRERERAHQREMKREWWRGQEGGVSWDPEPQREGIRGRHKTQSSGGKDTDRGGKR